jgi:ABC-type nickel/cobalt efflux system permease component RcnA
MTEVEALKALGAFPLVQAAVALLVIFAGIWMVFRGSREKKPANGNGTPQWTLYGPVHEVMGAVHQMNEQSREANKTLGRIEESVKTVEKEQREQTMLLEDIRNNQVTRTEMTVAHPAQVRRKTTP